MAAGGSPLRLGPFVGGLNTASDPTAIADAELTECMNMELDIDGSLISRNAFQELQGYTGFTQRVILLCEAIFSGNHYIIASNADGVFHYLNGTWTVITATFQASVAVQYADKVYLVPKPGSANPGGKWDPSGGFVAVAAIPQGQAAVIHKERLFIAPGELATTNASRLKFSDTGDFETWGASNFIDVSQGDGTNLVDLTVFQDNVILFKSQSSYVLAYDTRPTDAVVRKISLTIGVNKQFNMINYENQIYIFSGGWVYEVINYDFHRLNTKVPFIRDDTVPSAFSSESVFLSLIGDRLICRFFRKIYVYGLRTRTWSEWESVENPLHYFGPILTIHPTTGNEYYAGQCITAYGSIVKFYDKQISSSIESVLTPTYTTLDTYTRTVASGLGTTDTGELYTSSGGAASDYSVNGTAMQINLTSVSVDRTYSLPITRVNWDIVKTVSINKIPTGASMQHQCRARLSGNNLYVLTTEFLTGASGVRLVLTKVVAGASTLLGTYTLGTFSANEQVNYRFLLNGTSIRAKLWKTANSEPAGWNLAFTDAGYTGTGTVLWLETLTAGNLNFPIVATEDNLKIGDPTVGLTRLIDCRILTKNFDMAISHQYKRLWWWGADVSSNNAIMGIVTPIVVTFKSSWGSLASKTWGALNTWGSPTTIIESIETAAPTGTGTARRFAKFMKSLRYRQINFAIELTTQGSTVDGPARIFSLTAITESKEVVSKAVS
jgi:hypothetical protein